MSRDWKRKGLGPAASLTEIANMHGTDKGTECDHLAPKGYTVHYERLLGHRRRDRIKILEIGVWQGASLRLWEQGFPRAEIHGLDKTRACRDYGSPQSTVHVGDQSDPDVLAKLAKLGPWDLIVDDGGHKLELQRASFVGLWCSVRKGGLYVVEDLHADARSMKWAKLFRVGWAPWRPVSVELHPPSLLILQR